MKLRILIVEDEPVIAMLLGRLIEAMGHEVCATADTEGDAVAAAARCGPDMMIVDARLRLGSGIAAVETILRQRFIPHVFVSGDAPGLQDLRPRAVVVGKPFNEAELAEGIRRALQAGLAQVQDSP